MLHLVWEPCEIRRPLGTLFASALGNLVSSATYGHDVGGGAPAGRGWVMRNSCTAREKSESASGADTACKAGLLSTARAAVRSQVLASARSVASPPSPHPHPMPTNVPVLGRYVVARSRRGLAAGATKALGGSGVRRGVLVVPSTACCLRVDGPQLVMPAPLVWQCETVGRLQRRGVGASSIVNGGRGAWGAPWSGDAAVVTRSWCRKRSGLLCFKNTICTGQQDRRACPPTHATSRAGGNREPRKTQVSATCRSL